MNAFLKIIKHLDLFGYKIELNFDRKGLIHKTTFGGCLSILYVLVILSFVSLGFMNI